MRKDEDRAVELTLFRTSTRSQNASKSGMALTSFTRSTHYEAGTGEKVSLVATSWCSM